MASLSSFVFGDFLVKGTTYPHGIASTIRNDEPRDTCRQLKPVENMDNFVGPPARAKDHLEEPIIGTQKMHRADSRSARTQALASTTTESGETKIKASISIKTW